MESRQQRNHLRSFSNAHFVREQAAAGCAVLVVSSELAELIGLCDRIVVLHEGRIAGRFERGEANEEELLHVCYGRAA